jgi:hypothetical protein
MKSVRTVLLVIDDEKVAPPSMGEVAIRRLRACATRRVDLTASGCCNTATTQPFVILGSDQEITTDDSTTTIVA